jgi:hypothetical protein
MTDETHGAALTLSLVLPAFNEAENLPIVVERALQILPRYFQRFEIVIVNDGSRDGTGAVADGLAGAYSPVNVVHHLKNRGYGGALVSGFAASRGDFVMFMDADQQFDIEDIDRLTPFIESHDIVAGFRMERNDPIHRRAFAEIFNVTIRVLFGVHMRDIDCAFKVFQGDLLRSIALTSSGALINTEIQAKARRQGATVQQVGVRHFPRVAGSPTGGNPKIILRAMRDTPRLWWHMRSYDPPAGRPNSHGRHRIGDATLFAGLGSVVAGLAAFVRRK